MAQFASPLSVKFPQMYLQSQFEDSISCCYLETALKAKGDFSFYVQSISHGSIWSTACSRPSTDLPVELV